MSSENKIIDESLQGQPFMLGSKDPAITVGGKKLFLESYGCQMNFADSEIVASILIDKGFNTTSNFEEADVIFLNTCAIRENAELRVRNRLHDFKKAKLKNPKLVVGVLGCMAERLKSQLLEEEKLVDMVVGPDAYRDLPNLINEAEDGRKAINVILSKEETYADLKPVRLDSNGVTSFISIMRGCDNMCSFCVVPFTRGRERSRDPESIVNEAKDLVLQGYKEVTLLGQNVDSYLYAGGGLKKEKLTEEQKTNSTNFARLLEKVALIDAKLRVRFSTSHPKDMNDDVLYTMARYHNICKYIHLPVQSGNSRVLELMNRTYDREWYMNRVRAINRILPDCTISSDIIAGFCTETESEHQDTLSMMKFANYNLSYMFTYSERPGTLAARKYEDDIPEEVKKRRLAEIIRLQNQISLQHNLADIGKTVEVLVEGDSKRSELEFKGRNSQNKVVVFPKREDLKPGDYAFVKITDATSATLRGELV